MTTVTTTENLFKGVRRSFAIYGITKHGALKAVQLARSLPGADLFLSDKVLPHVETALKAIPSDSLELCAEEKFHDLEDLTPRVKKLPLPMGEFLKDHFTLYDCHVFVISVGAVVRMVAPLLQSKKVDPAVVCVDDDGRFAICTLSGHVGRGNSFTHRIADILGAEPVVTTASDVRGTLTVDILGRELGWTLADPDHNVTRGCAAVVNEEPVAMIQECGEPHWWPLKTPLPKGVSYFNDRSLVDPSQYGICLLATDRSFKHLDESFKKQSVVYHPRTLVLGIGCDRGTPLELLEEGVLGILDQAGLALASVAQVATIDLKADEPGLLALCERYRWPLVTYSAQELDQVKGMENPSDMVQKHTGTRGVAEPAALLAAGVDRLTLTKQKFTQEGVGRTMTLAVARREFARREEIGPDRGSFQVPESSRGISKDPSRNEPVGEPSKISLEVSSQTPQPGPQPVVPVGDLPGENPSPLGFAISFVDDPAPPSAAQVLQEKSEMSLGRLSLVGIGPGHRDHISPAALAAIEEADLVVGYRTYMLLVRALLKGKQTIKTGMTEEISRAQAAVEHAASGAKVALISSGDAGVYGMANLVFDVLKSRGWKVGMSPELRIIPGITALNSCASLVGAPLGHDSCMISLSDLLTPWDVIEKRIDAAAQSDFVIGLYNPASGRRQRQIVRAQELIRRYRPGTTPVALVKSAYRFREQINLTDLDHMLDFEIGMLTTVLIGNSHTYVYEGFMVTPRGYHHKYMWDGSVREGQTPGESLRLS
jgi:cobalt-precorrin 5A hydrolase